jgi:hypothetical protein
MWVEQLIKARWSVVNHGIDCIDSSIKKFFVNEEIGTTIRLSLVQVGYMQLGG